MRKKKTEIDEELYRELVQGWKDIQAGIVKLWNWAFPFLHIYLKGKSGKSAGFVWVKRQIRGKSAAPFLLLMRPESEYFLKHSILVNLPEF